MQRPINMLSDRGDRNGRASNGIKVRSIQEGFRMIGQRRPP